MNKSIILNTLSSALFVSLAVGCSKVEIPDQGINHESVSFFVESVSSSSGIETRSTNLTEEPLADSLYLLLTEEDWPVQADVATKGTIITTDSFQTTYSADGFGVYAEKSGDASTVLFNNAVFTYNDSSSFWLPSTNVYWPDYATDFYAWAPKGVASLSSSSKSFSYTVPVANADQKDLLVAKTSVGASNESAVSLVFTHALAAVRFAVGSTMTEGKITSLKICGLNTSGTYDMAAGTWGSLSSKEDLSLTTEVAVTGDTPAGTAITGDSETFFVMPQVCSDGASVQIVFDGETKTIPLPATQEFKAGKLYTFNLNHDEYTYVFDVTDNELVYDNTEATQDKSYKVKSYKYTGSDIEANRIPVSYSAEYSVDGGTTWAAFDANCGISGISSTGNSGYKSASSVALTAAIKIKTVDSPYKWTDDTVIAEDWDLSKMPIGGEVTSAPSGAVNTANCYIVKHPGSYRFPCVYGNAIKNGNPNSSGYIKSVATKASTSSANTLSTFLNANGDGIQNPYVLSDVVIGTNKRETISPKAALLWCDAKENNEIMIQDVKLNGTGSDAYISFKTASKDNLVQSNAVIVLYDDADGDGYDDGEALWSWHIWMTNADVSPSNTGVVGSKDGKYSGPYYFMSCNLGWCDCREVVTYTAKNENILIRLIQGDVSLKQSTVTVKQPEIFHARIMGNCPMFQYGRKDAFIGTRGYSDDDYNKSKLFYDAAGNELTFTSEHGTLFPENAAKPSHFYQQFPYDPSQDVSPNNHETADMNIKNSIKYPFTFAVNLAYDNWYCNLWSINNEYIGINYKQNYFTKDDKTVYDPCPYGYVMTNDSAYRYFTSTGDKASINGSKGIIYGVWDDVFGKKGYTIFEAGTENTTKIPDPNLFFPSAGARASTDSGVLFDVSTRGNYVTAVPYDTYRNLALYFDKNEMTSLNGCYKSGGYSVRPILESAPSVTE